jgi:hypothetical protein
VKKTEEAKPDISSAGANDFNDGDEPEIMSLAERMKKHMAVSPVPTKKTAPKKPAEEKKELNAAVRNAIKSLQQLVKKKVITKAQFEKQKKSILAFKNKK